MFLLFFDVSQYKLELKLSEYREEVGNTLLALLMNVARESRTYITILEFIYNKVHSSLRNKVYVWLVLYLSVIQRV